MEKDAAKKVTVASIALDYGGAVAGAGLVLGLLYIVAFGNWPEGNETLRLTILGGALFCAFLTMWLGQGAGTLSSGKIVSFKISAGMDGAQLEMADEGESKDETYGTYRPYWRSRHGAPDNPDMGEEPDA